MAAPVASAGAIALRHPRPLAQAVAALAAGLLALALLMAVAISALLGGQSAPLPAAGLPAGARPFLAIYADAAAVYRVNPYVLMAIHENESGFSSASQPGVADGINFAGCCAGPMQFLITGGASAAIGGSGGTWAAYADAYRRARLPRPSSYPLRHVRPHPNVYDSYDAIYAAADYLHQLGAGAHLDGRTYHALLSYTGTPPASIPYAQHDFRRAKELEAIAQRHLLADGGEGPAVTGGRLAWPLPRPYTSISSPFGMRWGRLHAGVDIPAPVGTRIYAAASGRVSIRGWVGGYGNYTCIQHQGPYSTCYAHQSSFGPVPPGGLIARGGLAGYVGCTGHCFGEHLHFELRQNGQPIDPAPFLGG